MCVLSLLSDEKKHWLKQRVELYGCHLDLNENLFEQVKRLPNHVINQIALDVSLREMYSKTSLCDQNVEQFKQELDKVRKRDLSPQVFRELIIQSSNQPSSHVA
mgnify:CR=1 FL=1